MHNQRFTVGRQYRESWPGWILGMLLQWVWGRNLGGGVILEFRTGGGRVVWENSDVRKSGRKNVQVL